MVEQSSAAINQMLASVTSVASITADQTEITESLIKASDEGFRKITESAVIISDISDSVDDIKETAKVISAIAAQTNRLAVLAENLKTAMSKIGNKSNTISSNIESLNDGIERVISVFKT